MKNPIQHLKHLWKDPINTLQEADQRKKEILPWLFGCGGSAVLFCVLSSVLDIGFFMVLGCIAIFGALFFGFLLSVIAKAKERFRALTCNKCNTLAALKTHEEFEKYVNFTVEESAAEYKGVSHPASNNGVVSKIEATGSASAVVSIRLSCPSCGSVKELKYYVTPFRCSVTEEKVGVLQVETVKMRLENSIREVIAAYNNPEKRAEIPYSIHSTKNPKYKDRTKVQVGNSWIPRYNGVKIDFRKDVEEMVEHFFIENQLDGKIVDESK